MINSAATSRPSASTRQMLLPLALAQFICSFAGSNMNVAIDSISKDLGTTVQGVQITITMFLLVMAALMIPGSKLTDPLGRKRCFTAGLMVYGAGALIGALAPGLGVLILGYSIFEGVGSALLIPPVYILTTMLFTDITSRARAFGVISGMAGIGAATGPLIGGLITTTVSWRLSFVLQAVVVGLIVVLSRNLVDPVAPDPSRRFDVVGAVLSGAGLFFVVFGILQAGTRTGLMLAFLLVGALFLAWFLWHIRRRERAGQEPLLSIALFRNRTSDLALITQNVQWLILMGASFTLSVYLQTVRNYSAIKTGLVLTAATVGLLLSSLAAERFAKRREQRTLIMGGFVITVVGIALLVGLVYLSSNVAAFLPGLFLLGFGVGGMLTPSVNVVQSSFSEELQGEISGLSRSLSNLGSSLGTAIAGTILVVAVSAGTRSFALAMAALAAAGLVGLVTAFFLPRNG